VYRFLPAFQTRIVIGYCPTNCNFTIILSAGVRLGTRIFCFEYMICEIREIIGSEKAVLIWRISVVVPE